jgi:epoxyqueuosine reductase
MPEKRCTLGGLTMSDYSGKFTEELETFCRQKGADLFGIADLEPARDFLASHGDPIATGYPRAISIGMQINDTIVENHDPDEPRGKSLYWHHIYEVVSQSLNFVAYDVSRWLANYGWDALPVPASMPYNLKKRQGVISHKLPAHLAGLGWIGKNCLLLTSEFGPRIRFATVLTDAPLNVTGEPMNEQCGTCNQCVEICPVKAFTGEPYRTGEPRETRYDASKCDRYFDWLEEKGKLSVCGLCLYICPIGRQ